jgi:hypothetical protein
MGVGEARNGRFSIAMDVAYAKLGADIDTPFGLITNKIDVAAKTFMGTIVAGYSIFDGEAAHIDAIAGARLWSVDTDFNFDGGRLDGQSVSDGDTWVDPVIGAKFRTDIGSGFYISGWGIIGGFGVSSDFMWDVLGGLGYNFSETFSVFAGYRAADVDYQHNGFVYDVTQHGPIIGGDLRF